MIYLSDEALRADTFPEENGLFRQITHEPIGIVYVIVGVLRSAMRSVMVVYSPRIVMIATRRRGTTRS